MKKRIEYKIEDNDLDKVSGGASWDGAFRPLSNQYHIHPYYCQHCGFLMGEEEDINVMVSRRSNANQITTPMRMAHTASSEAAHSGIHERSEMIFFECL